MALLRRLKRNDLGRDLVVGDVHGHFSLLHKALAYVGFDPRQDRLISVGDLVDRGPESLDVLDFLQLPWVHAVRGNHEDMAIDYAAGAAERNWYAANGGAWLIGQPKHVQMEVREALLALPVAIEVPTPHGLVGVVHADVPTPGWPEFVSALQDARLPMSELQRLVSTAQWSRRRLEHGDRRGVLGVEAVIVGHTPMSLPRSLGNVLHIDTGAWLGQAFTLVDITHTKIHIVSTEVLQ